MMPSVSAIKRTLDAPQLDAWKVNVQVEGTARAAYGNPPVDGELEDSYVARLKGAAEELEHERIAREAADVGTQCHALIEHEVKRQLGIEAPAPEASDEAMFRFAGWKEWASKSGLCPLMS